MKIIFFSSNTEVWYFALAEAAIANAFKKLGHDVVYITPGNKFKNKSNLTNEKILRTEFNLSGYDISHSLTNNDIDKINDILLKINRNNFDKLIINNINLGKISLYEFLLHHKKIAFNFTDNEWKECLHEIEDTLVSFFACKRIINNEKPDVILMYNTLYSVNHAWKKYADKKKIAVYFIHNGLNFSDLKNTLIIAKNNSIDYINKLMVLWLKFKNIPSSKKMLSYSTNHFLELLKANHFLVYSAPKSKKQINIKEYFNINENNKILTATMSSYDELLAAEYVGARKKPKRIIFNSQIDWIESLINYVKNKENISLIIRIHPREFPNKRDSVKSEHAALLERILQKLPNNVKINWPADNISIYDLAQETDVFLNAWSSVGVEMSLLGIPVVIYSEELILYPSDLNYLGKNKDDYYSKIELALKEGWSYKIIKKTYRWLSLYYYYTIVRIKNKKEIIGKTKKNNKLASKFLNSVYLKIHPKTRDFIRKFLIKVPGSNIGERQIADCKDQLKDNIDISKVEEMIIESRDTIISPKEIVINKVTSEEEDILIKNEIKRIYEAMYGTGIETSKIKNSLQYNLKNIIS